MIKYLEKKIEILTNEDSGDLKQNMELEYYLIESDINGFDGISEEKVYGIEIIKKMEEERYECEMVKNYSCCADSVKSVLKKLASNTVTPVGLPFILDDLLGA